MSFQTGLSGLNASSRSLDVIGNNIANANTTGMKSSRTEFSAMYSSMLGFGGASNNGIGVEVGSVAQQFTQGSLSTTGNSLDVAVNGNGFFQLTQTDGTKAYTRDGSFKLDKDGYVKTNADANVMGFPTDKNGIATSVSIQKLQLPTSAPIAASATTTVTAELNLDARAAVATTVVPPTAIETYGTSLTAFDTQGSAVPVSLYFVKIGPNPSASPPITIDTWDVFDTNTVAAGRASLITNGPQMAADALDFKNTALNAANGNLLLPTYTNAPPGGFVLPNPGTALVSSGAAYQMTFDGNGKLLQTQNYTMTPGVFPAPNTYGGALTTTTTPLAFDLALTSPNPAIGSFTAALAVPKVTTFGTSFSVSNLTQDGYTAGELTGIAIGEDGVISARYSNGQTQAAGQLALADFRNSQGLTPLGGNAWSETFASGQPISGSPGTGKFGALRAGALEDSNVELTAELVNMMTAQRAYQANAQTIKTQDQIMTTLVNLR